VLESRNSRVRRYKYRVESSATKEGVLNSWEFISGPKPNLSDIVDRSLKLYDDNATCGGKLSS